MLDRMLGLTCHDWGRRRSLERREQGRGEGQADEASAGSESGGGGEESSSSSSSNDGAGGRHATDARGRAKSSTRWSPKKQQRQQRQQRQHCASAPSSCLRPPPASAPAASTPAASAPASAPATSRPPPSTSSGSTISSTQSPLSSPPSMHEKAYAWSQWQASLDAPARSRVELGVHSTRSAASFSHRQKGRNPYTTITYINTYKCGYLQAGAGDLRGVTGNVAAKERERKYPERC